MAQFIKEMIQKTRAANMSPRPQDLGTVPQPPLELPVPPDSELLYLPTPSGLNLPEISLRQAVEQRRSRRKYQETPLSLAELSYLLWMTQGVKEFTNRPATKRTVPSAGARHAIETWVLVNRVEGLEKGLYRFAAGKHALVRLEAQESISQDVARGCYDQNQVTTSAVTFAWVGVSERMTWRYVERGFRYLLLDAGHICQNCYLAAEAIQCGVCAIGGFNDDEINRVLGLDGENLWVVYLASVGKR